MKSRSSKGIQHIHTRSQPRGKIRGWMLEFGLVFIAVSLGFFADRWREKLYEREREKQFMTAMYHDLNSDINEFNLNIKKSIVVTNAINQLITLLNSQKKYDSALSIYHYARSVTLSTPYYEPNQRTYEQMKYSGELRLIRDPTVADSVTGYYNSLVWILTQNSYVHDRLGDFMGGAENLFDGKVFLLILEQEPDSIIQKALPKNFYITTDPLLLNKLFVRSQYLSGACKVTVPAAERALERCKNLRSLLKQKYNIYD